MKKLLLILLLAGLTIGCSKIKNEELNDNYMKKETLKIIINDVEYKLILENNETAEKFIEFLPKEFNMNELNGNEKYAYLDFSLPTKSLNPKHIKQGDVYIYNDNCLVIFYKSFDTSYSYTKLGHINNLEDLGNDNVFVKIEKYRKVLD